MYPRAVFIGPREIGELIRMNRNDLDFLYRFSHIEELYDKIINEEINHDFEIIITIDQLFFSNKNTNNNYEHMIAALSTRFLVIIIQYNPNEEKELREKYLMLQLTWVSILKETTFLYPLKNRI